jgi:hypothetical protein
MKFYPDQMKLVVVTVNHIFTFIIEQTGPIAFHVKDHV